MDTRVDDRWHELSKLSFVDTPELSRLLKLKGNLKEDSLSYIFNDVVRPDNRLKESFEQRLEKEVDKVYTKYPLLRLYDGGKDFEDYVKLMDEKEKELV